MRAVGIFDRKIDKAAKQLVALYEAVPDGVRDKLVILFSAGRVLREHEVVYFEAPSRGAAGVRVAHGEQPRLPTPR